MCFFILTVLIKVVFVGKNVFTDIFCFILVDILIFFVSKCVAFAFREEIF